MYGQNGKYSKLGRLISDETAKRLEEERKRLKPVKMTYQQLGEELDISDTNAMRILKTEHMLNIKQFIEMCMIFKIDPVEVFTEICGKHIRKKV